MTWPTFMYRVTWTFHLIFTAGGITSGMDKEYARGAYFLLIVVLLVPAEKYWDERRNKAMSTTVEEREK